MPRSNKFVKFDDIPLAQLFLGKSNVRTENIEEGLDDLAEHIYANGLLETIVVFDIRDLKEDHPLYESRKDFLKKKKTHEVLAGQRRFNAFLKLMTDFPKEGWDTIPCHIRVPPDDEDDAKAISVGENLTQLPMTLADSIDACDALYKKYNDEKTISRKYGISVRLVKKYVKFARLPKILQDNLSAFHKQPKTAMNIALDAVDALDYTKDGDQPVEKVYEFAKKLGAKKKIAEEDYKKLKKAGEENKNKTLDEINEKANKMRNPKMYKVVLDPDDSDDLQESAKKQGNEPEVEAAEIVHDGLKTRLSKDQKSE